MRFFSSVTAMEADVKLFCVSGNAVSPVVRGTAYAFRGGIDGIDEAFRIGRNGCLQFLIHFMLGACYDGSFF